MRKKVKNFQIFFSKRVIPFDYLFTRSNICLDISLLLLLK